MKRPIKQRSRFHPRLNNCSISQSTCLCLLLCAAMSVEAQAQESTEELHDDSSASETTSSSAPVSIAAAEEVAPYQLKIIKRGEARAIGSNSNPEGQQQNRRADVKLIVNPKTPDVIASSAQIAGGGSVWITRDPAALERLLRVETAASLPIENGKPVKPVEFKVSTNYPFFIKRAEILIYRDGDSESERPLHKIPFELTGLLSDVVWDGVVPGVNGWDDGALLHGDGFEYALRVYDAQDNFDQTHANSVRIVEKRRVENGSAEAAVLSGDDAELTLQSESGIEDEFESVNNEEGSQGYDPLVVQGIVIAGARVRVHGQDLGVGSGFEDNVLINGDTLAVTSKGEFIAEYLLPSGVHDFNVSANRSTPGETGFSENISTKVDTNYFFLVGLADLTIGENDVSGNIEPLVANEPQFDGDLFVDGRLAFYLKGKVKGKYLITAQFDTGTEDIEDIFDNFDQRDPRSVFRRLDPDQYYLVYGDDSNLYDDTDSQGKFYLRVEWDKSRALWGNFNTAFTGTELAPFNRSLYGGHLRHRSVENTALGDTKTEISVFASEAQTAFRHNEFLGTGGSLYYLRDQDIVLGSEKVWVEVRQNGGERVVEKIPLIVGRDYDIDEFQGRIILKRPLVATPAFSGPTIIRDEPIDGYESYLVVDCTTLAQEGRDGDDYSIAGVDLTLKKSGDTYVRVEVAHTEASQTAGSFLSNDGGLSFQAFNSNDGSTRGNAINIEGRLSLNDLLSDTPSLETNDVHAGAWYKFREADYSVADVDTGADTTDAGFELIAEVNSDLSIESRATLLERENELRESAISLQGNYSVSERLRLSAEVQGVREENLAQNTDGDAILGAGKIGYDVSDSLSIFSVAQATLSNSGTYEDNNQFRFGADYQFSDRLLLKGEVTTGNRGDALLAGAEFQLSDSYSVYSNVSHEISDQSVIRQAATFGQRKQISRRLKVFTEHQLSHEDERQGASHTLGLDHAFNDFLSANLSVQFGNFEDDAGQTTNRDALTLGVDMRTEALRASSKFEYRRDRGAVIDLDQFVSTNRFEYRSSVALRWQGRLNISWTDDKQAGIEDAEFVEAGIGFAFRPVYNDRLNMLGRLTYLSDLPPLSQSSETDKRSLIASVEGIYDINTLWSVGAKFAHRDGEERIVRGDGPFTGNDASLAGLRLHYRVPFGLELLGSWRWLSSDATDGVTQGALVTVGAAVDDHLNLSLGYNFTDFDDNLANDSFDVGGWFFNLVGRF